MKKLQKEITNWHKATFPEATRENVVNKAKEELSELMAELDDYVPHEVRLENVIEESADVVIIISALLGRLGVNLNAAVRDKMNINKKRKWSADGMVRK